MIVLKYLYFSYLRRLVYIPFGLGGISDLRPCPETPMPVRDADVLLTRILFIAVQSACSPAERRQDGSY